MTSTPFASPEMQEFIVEHGESRVYGKIAYPMGKGPWPVVVFSHGFAACRVYDSGMERAFIERGLAFAAFDFCSGVHGSQSSGISREMSVLTEARDLEAVVGWVRALDCVDESRMFLLGSSQGGYVSAYVAGGAPEDFVGLGLFFPAFNIGDDARTRVAANGGAIPDETIRGPLVLGRRYDEDALSVDIFDRIGSYAGDVLIVHGSRDEIVPLAYSQRAVQAFPGSCRLEVFEGLGHGFRSSPPSVHKQALDLAADFFLAHA